MGPAKVITVDFSGWAPVVAAIATGMLTGWVPLGVVAVRRRYALRDATASERAEAYGSFVSAVPDFVIRIEGLAAVARLRSGLQEGLSVPLRQRRQLEPTDVFDWTLRDLRSLQTARSRIELVGSQAPIDAADVVMDACIDYLELATAIDKTRGVTARVVIGERWSKEAPKY